jgi:lysophospholipase L1-like esterase
MARHVRLQPAGAGQLSYDVTGSLQAQPGNLLRHARHRRDLRGLPDRDDATDWGDDDRGRQWRVVPGASGVTDCLGAVVFTCFALAGPDTLFIDDGATLKDVRLFHQIHVTCACATTAALSFAAVYQLQMDGFSVISLAATAAVPAISVPNGGTLEVLTDQGCEFDSTLAGATPVIFLGTGTTLVWSAYRQLSLLGTNTVTGGGGGSTINYNHDATTGAQNWLGLGFVGTVNDLRGAQAALAAPAAGPTPPTNTAGLADTVEAGQLFWNTALGILQEYDAVAQTWVGTPGTQAQANPIVVATVGDSNMTGAQFGGPRQQFWAKLRAKRGDFTMLGPFAGGGDQGRYILGDWRQNAIGGSTLTSWQTAGANPYLGTVVTPYGQPTAILLMLGSNDVVVGGMTLATMQANFNLLAAQMIAASPQARVIVSSIPPRLDSGAGPQALAVAYNAALPALVAGLGTALWSFVDGCNGMTQADLNADLVHLNEYGCAKLGAQMAAAFQAAFPAPNGLSYPRSFMPRTQPQVARLTTPGADFLAINGAGQQPTSATSFAYSFWLNPDKLAGTVQGLICIAGVGDGFQCTINPR